MKKETSYSLLPHNTFGINAICSRFYEYSSESELRDILAETAARPDEPLLHIGSGSNLLFTKDFDGSVLHSAIKGLEASCLDDGETVLVRAGAGEDWDCVVGRCTAEGWYGLENLSLIPGEVGASAVQNIGANGSEAADFIEQTEAICLSTGECRTFTNAESRYGYRTSIFKQELRGKYAITHVTYRLSRKFSPNLGYGGLAQELSRQQISPASLTPENLRNLIIDIRRNKLPDPSETGSAGSFFINPVVSTEKFTVLQEKYPDMPHYTVEHGVKIPAGWLIERCGWKGKNLGPAGVYAKQALVLVNLGGAKGCDIVRLSDAIRKDVSATFGIEIHPEVNFI